jgi:hypothetical protein
MSLAALTFLFVSGGSHGQLAPSMQYLNAQFEMAKRMRLFGVRNPVTDDELALMDESDRITTVHAAWGAFNVLMWATRQRTSAKLELIKPGCSPSSIFETPSSSYHYFRYPETLGG